MKDAGIYISVILPLRLEWEPCYRLPPDCRTEGDEAGDGTAGTGTGSRVRVMFAGKEYIGVVSGIVPDPGMDPGRIKDVLSVEKSLERISWQEIELWRQVSSYYMCTVGEVYKAAYPMQKISSEEAIARKADRLKKREMAETAAAIRKAGMSAERIERVLMSLEARKTALSDRKARKLELAGKSRKDSTREKHVCDAEKLGGEIVSIEARISEAKDRLAETRAFSDRLKESLSRMKDGTDTRAGRPQARDYAAATGHDGIILSADQQKAMESIRREFTDGKTVLLKGITGSGKTEIYIKLAEEAMSEGRNVLYLVPEIALGKQLEDRLRAIFGDRLLTFHSGESATRRAEVAGEIRGRTSCSIVIGTRSALFLPHRNLGLIIIDEEHDSSYKQDSPAPRYNGRDTAIMLGGIHSSHVLLGSATPSLESLYNCRSGKYALIELNKRYHGAPDAEVMLVDTLAERRKRGMSGSLSLKLLLKMEETLKNGGQTIILRSRRSYSPSLQCSSCGYIPKCPRCNVSLSYHKSSGSDTCHYCGFSVAHTGICPKCGGELAGLGAGTQKIEEEIAARFPGAKVARLDSDSAQDRKYESDAIRKFARGETDILVGTQMVTKGFDFGRLELVAVIGSDSLLAAQDFRADEKAVQILEQFRGRCGRRGHRGTFIIQTCQPDHPVYQRILHNGMDEGTDRLMEERREFGYPPFCRIIDITVRDSREDRAVAMSDRLAVSLSGKGFRFTGPYHTGSGKTSGSFIRTVRVSLPKDRHLSDSKSKLLDTVLGFEREARYQGHISIDVDPC